MPHRKSDKKNSSQQKFHTFFFILTFYFFSLFYFIFCKILFILSFELKYFDYKLTNPYQMLKIDPYTNQVGFSGVHKLFMCTCKHGLKFSDLKLLNNLEKKTFK